MFQLSHDMTQELEKTARQELNFNTNMPIPIAAPRPLSTKPKFIRRRLLENNKSQAENQYDSDQSLKSLHAKILLGEDKGIIPNKP